MQWGNNTAIFPHSLDLGLLVEDKLVLNLHVSRCVMHALHVASTFFLIFYSLSFLSLVPAFPNSELQL